MARIVLDLTDREAEALRTLVEGLDEEFTDSPLSYVDEDYVDDGVRALGKLRDGLEDA